MDKIEVTQADIDEATSALSNIRGYKVRIYPEHSLVQAFARHRLSHTPQSVEPVATDVAALVEAVKELAELAHMHMIGGYGHAIDNVFAALAPFTKGQNDDAVR